MTKRSPTDRRVGADRRQFHGLGPDPLDFHVAHDVIAGQTMKLTWPANRYKVQSYLHPILNTWVTDLSLWITDSSLAVEEPHRGRKITLRLSRLQLKQLRGEVSKGLRLRTKHARKVRAKAVPKDNG